MKNHVIMITVLILLFLIFFKTKQRINMTRFELFMHKLLKHEGGYVNDPDDLGGETKFGITKRRYPNLDIKNLTKAEAIEIYKRDFYIPLKIDDIENKNLAFNFFDMAVNAGAKVAKDLLSKSFNDPDIYRELRIAYYEKVATYRNNQKFLKGWLNRVESSNIA